MLTSCLGPRWGRVKCENQAVGSAAKRSNDTTPTEAWKMSRVARFCRVIPSKPVLRRRKLTVTTRDHVTATGPAVIVSDATSSSS